MNDLVVTNLGKPNVAVPNVGNVILAKANKATTDIVFSYGKEEGVFIYYDYTS